MLKLIKRCPEYVQGYREYCRELYENGEPYFRPTPPDAIDETWFERTKPWYDKKEQGLLPGVARSCHYWAVDGDRFIGEFQCRTDFTEKVLFDIGSVGYAVRPSEWGKGYGTMILRQGLEIAKSLGMDEKNVLIARTREMTLLPMKRTMPLPPCRYSRISSITANAPRMPSTAADTIPPAYPAPSPQGINPFMLL